MKLINSIKLTIISTQAELKDGQKLLTKSLNSLNSMTGLKEKRIYNKLVKISNKSLEDEREFNLKLDSEIIKNGGEWNNGSYTTFKNRWIKKLGIKRPDFLSKEVKQTLPYFFTSHNDIVSKLKSIKPTNDIDREFINNYLQVLTAMNPFIAKVAKFKTLIEDGQKRLKTRIEVIKGVKSLVGKKNREINEYLVTLNEWVESKAIDTDTMIINGTTTQNKSWVGVLIGRGDRVHPMIAKSVFIKELNKYEIVLENYTQWQKSNLIILDTMENIPKHLFSY